jgi:nucleotide-binding universal stress UspA family protein
MLADIATARPSTGFMPRTPLQLRGRTVLLATDGSPAALAAAKVAGELASRHNAAIHVVSVMDTRSAPMPPPLDLAVAIADASIGEAIHDEQAAAVRATIEAAVGEAVAWDVRVVLGTPAKAIIREARRLKASLIVVGLRRHGRMDRAIHDETTLEVIRHAACPVLGVAEGAAGLPRKALAAVDFSLASLAAARAARAVLADGGAIVLAYVPPVTFDLPDDGEEVIHRLGVDAGFAQVRAELAEDGFAFDSVVLHRAAARPMAELLLEYADGAKCDLIAAGSGRRGRVDRWMLGSVSTELVRDGRHSVLVTPPRQPARRVG